MIKLKYGDYSTFSYKPLVVDTISSVHFAYSTDKFDIKSNLLNILGSDYYTKFIYYIMIEDLDNEVICFNDLKDMYTYIIDVLYKCEYNSPVLESALGELIDEIKILDEHQEVNLSLPEVKKSNRSIIKI